MDILRDFFNNREIAIILWFIIFVTFICFNKDVRESIKNVMTTLFCKKFVIFYLIFLGYFISIIYLLFKIEFWNISLLKDTLFWVLFVQFPIFGKAIENGKDGSFFSNLILKNIAFIGLIKFIVNFWTFNLFFELIIVPFFVFLGVVYAFSLKDRKYRSVKRVLEGFFTIYLIFVFINVILSTINSPEKLLSINNLKSILLPIILLFLNLPIIYGLALHNLYEQVFIRLKGNDLEQRKMKLTLILFSGIILSKISFVRNNMMLTTGISLTDIELKRNLNKLQEKMNYQVGVNYMKRSKKYLLGSVSGLLISFIGVFVCNTQVGLNDILSFNFVLNIERIKTIATYIFSCGVIVFFVLLIISIGIKKKKYEEISNVKKYVLYDLLYMLKKQNSLFQEFIPIESPKELYIQYIWFVYELINICESNIQKYENLLTRWEIDSLKQLQNSLDSVAINVQIQSEDFNKYSIDNFCKFFIENKENAPHNEKINTYIYDVEESLKKYEEKIKICMEEFKYIIR